jgi:triosephosphate isomerase
MTVIFLLWRRIKDRQSENHFNVVENQLRDGLFHIESKDWESIAYEPVWAIGTGETARNKHRKCMNSSEKQFEKLWK